MFFGAFFFRPRARVVYATLSLSSLFFILLSFLFSLFLFCLPMLTDAYRCLPWLTVSHFAYEFPADWARESGKLPATRREKRQRKPVLSVTYSSGYAGIMIALIISGGEHETVRLRIIVEAAADVSRGGREAAL